MEYLAIKRNEILISLMNPANIVKRKKPVTKTKFCTIPLILSPLYLWFCILRFNQPQMENIQGKNDIVANVYYVVTSATVVSVLNICRLFSLSFFP